MKMTVLAFRIRIAITAILVLVLGLLAAPPAAAATYPNSMDALGDSMTRAYNTCDIGWIDCPNRSWATGTDTTVDSYYSRLLTVNPSIRGNNHNDAVSGAKMADLYRQAGNAVSRNVDLVTVLMGNNDACASSLSAMTSVSDFQTQFGSAMSRLTGGLPSADIKVASIPDIYQLWELFHTDPTAFNTWETLQVCQALLDNPTSTAPADMQRRQTFRQRIIDYNSVLHNVCARYTRCEYDGGAGFTTNFQKIHVSTRDYFHPSVQGQALIADVTWNTLGY